MTPAAGSSVALAHRIAPELIDDLDTADSSQQRERAITVDQTNTSVVVDETVIVKWFDPPVPHPHPGLDVLAHLAELAERADSDVPHFHGAEILDHTVVATVSEYVVGAVDGWEWFVDELESTDAAAVDWAARIGALAARLHLDLATPSSVFPDPVASAAVTDEHQRCLGLLDAADRITTSEVRAVLSPRLATIRAVIDGLADAGTTTVMPIHDDLHVGQVLRAGDRLVLTDFDGNPIGAADRSGRRRPAAADVASLVQSIDHAGRVAIRRAPDRSAAIEPLIDQSCQALLSAYRTELHAQGHSDLLDERLLPAFRWAQELHELVYANRHLPRWTYAPLGTLTAMLP